MKRILTTLPLLAILGLFAGCATTPGGGTVIDPVRAKQIATGLKTVVSGSVVYAYSKDTNAVRWVQVAESAVETFALGSDLSAAALQAELQAIPVPELHTPEALLIETTILAAYQVYGQEFVVGGLDQNQGLKLLIQAVVDGMKAGLAGIQTANAAGLIPAKK